MRPDANPGDLIREGVGDALEVAHAADMASEEVRDFADEVAGLAEELVSTLDEVADRVDGIRKQLWDLSYQSGPILDA